MFSQNFRDASWLPIEAIEPAGCQGWWTPGLLYPSPFRLFSLRMHNTPLQAGVPPDIVVDEAQGDSVKRV